MNETTKIILVGLGGQGVLFAGKILANAAVISGYKATFIPSLSAEVHNGKVTAEIIISKDTIYNPFVTHADIIMVFHKFRLEEALSFSNENTKLFTKDFSSVNNGIESIKIDTESISENLKNNVISNMIMLGVLSAYIKIDDKSISESLKQNLIHKPYNTVSLNFKAYKSGKEQVKMKV